MGGGRGNFTENILSGIAASLNGIAITNSAIGNLGDPSAVANGYMTMELFSGVVPTATVTTGATINVKPSCSQTILIDVTGVLVSGTAAATGATGLIFTLRGGLSGFGFISTRVFTAGLGQFAWKVAAAGVTTGATAETTGMTRYDDMFLQVNNPTTSTGGSITVRARAFLSPSF